MVDDVNPAGPVFLSYRHSDGNPIAVELSWLLRAGGVPVWHDITDLPPGDTMARLREALTVGIAGAVLIVTPDIARSVIVRTVELPELLARRPLPDFFLAVANTVRGPDGGLDYTAPDALLQRPQGTLASLNQNSGAGRDGLLEIVREAVRHRLLRTEGQEAGVLVLDIQTRSVPVARPRTEADLNLRIRPPAGTRLPDPQGLRDLADGLRFLPEAVALSGATTVRVTGGAHLSAAFALGAALPATLVGDLRVVDTAAYTWVAPTVSALPQGLHALVEVGQGNGDADVAGRPRVLLYADLLASPSDGAYIRFLDEHGAGFAAWTHLRLRVPEPLDPDAAGPLVAELAYRVRALTNQFDNGTKHLFLLAWDDYHTNHVIRNKVQQLSAVLGGLIGVLPGLVTLAGILAYRFAGDTADWRGGEWTLFWTDPGLGLLLIFMWINIAALYKRIGKKHIGRHGPPQPVAPEDGAAPAGS